MCGFQVAKEAYPGFGPFSQAKSGAHKLCQHLQGRETRWICIKTEQGLDVSLSLFRIVDAKPLKKALGPPGILTDDEMKIPRQLNLPTIAYMQQIYALQRGDQLEGRRTSRK